MIGLIGKKIGMTQIFRENGEVIPVTIIQAGPCRVVLRKQKKTPEELASPANRFKNNPGYDAIQLGYEEVPEKRVTKPLRGHFKKHNSPCFRYLREMRLEHYIDVKEIEVGEIFDVSMFRTDELVTVRGTSKGKGFTGVMKRHNFHGFKQTHGVHESYRGPGSIGQCATPSRVFKGKKLPGHKGVESVTVKGLRVASVDEANNLIMVRGAVPGHRNSIVLLEKEV